MRCHSSPQDMWLVGRNHLGSGLRWMDRLWPLIEIGGDLGCCWIRSVQFVVECLFVPFLSICFSWRSVQWHMPSSQTSQCDSIVTFVLYNRRSMTWLSALTQTRTSRLQWKVSQVACASSFNESAMCEKLLYIIDLYFWCIRLKCRVFLMVGQEPLHDLTWGHVK